MTTQDSMDPNVREDAKKKKSLEYSIKDGSFFSVMTGFGEQYLIPFAVELGASNFQVGLLGSLPMFIASLLQLYTARTVEYLKSRKRTITNFVLLQAFVWLLLSCLPACDLPGRVYLLIILSILYYSFGQFIVPVWNSLMGDLVNERERGRFFGRRNHITGAAAFLSMFAAGLVLYLYSPERLFEGYAIVFLVAFAARIISWTYLKRTYEPARDGSRQEYFTFGQYVRKLRHTNYGKFALYYSLMNLSVNVAGPFFTVYMLSHLKLSYLEYTLVTAAATLTTFLAMSYWGRAADRFGNRRIINFCGSMIPLVPIMWLFTGNVYYLITIQIFTGLLWGGFNLSSANFIYDNVKPVNRTRIFAYHNVLNGTCLFAGALLGGLLASTIKDPGIFDSVLQSLFLLSGLMRAAASLYFLPKIREIRDVENITNREFFLKYSGIGPVRGLSYRTFHILTGLPKTKKIEKE